MFYTAGNKTFVGILTRLALIKLKIHSFDLSLQGFVAI